MKLPTEKNPFAVAGPIEFTKLEVADRDLYLKYYNRNPIYISDICFNSRIAWNGGFNYHKAVIADTLVVVAYDDRFTDFHFAAPVGLHGSTDLQAIIDVLWDPYAALSAVLPRKENLQNYRYITTGENGEFCELPVPTLAQEEIPGADKGNSPFLRFMFVDETQLSYFTNLKGYRTEVYYNPDYSDYFYDGEKMRTLAGKALHAKRNHLTQFMNDHPNAVYAPLQASDGPDAVLLSRVSALAAGKDPDNIKQGDSPAIAAFFAAFPQLLTGGGTIRENGELLAFAAYSQNGDDCVFCHFEKAAVGHEDAYVAINALTLRNEFPNVRFVNREEDIGLPHLRKAKMSYHPLKKINKYEVWIYRLR